MGQGPDALRELFRISPEAEAAGQTATLAPRDLLARIQTSLGLRSLTIGDVAGVVTLSDRNGDGAASYSELKRLLRPAPFADAITRVLRHGAAMLRAGGRSSMSREIGSVAAAAQAAALAARRPFPPPAPDGSPTLTHPALRTLLLDRLGLPLTDAQLAALGQALDVDDDGGCDSSELLFLAGEGSWAEAAARDRESLQPLPLDVQQRQRSQHAAPSQQVHAHAPRPRPPAGPLSDYCDLVPPGVDVLDDTWDVPLALLSPQSQQHQHGGYAAPPPAHIDPLAGLRIFPPSSRGGGGGGGYFGHLATAVDVPGALPPLAPYAPAAPHGPIPSPADVYALPLPPATALALFAPHDLAAASLSALRWPLPPHLRPAGGAPGRGGGRDGRGRSRRGGEEEEWRAPEPPLGAAALHDGYVSSPHPWPGLVDHAFASFATAALPSVFGQGGGGGGGGGPAPAPPPPILSLDPRALGQALAALGIPRTSHSLDALAARFAGGHGTVPPPSALGPMHRVGAAEFRALVDEVAAAAPGSWGLHSVAEARIRRALAAAACGAGAPPVPGETAAASLLSRAEVACALLAAAGGPAALTEAEAAAVAAWAPGPAQAAALAAVAGARLLALVEAAALTTRHTVSVAALAAAAAGQGPGADAVGVGARRSVIRACS